VGAAGSTVISENLEAQERHRLKSLRYVSVVLSALEPRTTSGNLSAKRRRTGSCTWESSVHMGLEKTKQKEKGYMLGNKNLKETMIRIHRGGVKQGMGAHHPRRTAVVTETRPRRDHQGTRDLKRGTSETQRLLPPRHTSKERNRP